MEFEQGEVIWRARGDHGWTDDDSVIVRRTDGKDEVRALPAMPLYGRRGSLNAFAEAVAGNLLPEPDISGRNNLVTLDMALSAVRSAAEGRRIDFSHSSCT
jgi:predicted dehydrogenase